MRRAVLTLGGTVAGLAALFSFRTHSVSVAAAEPASTPLSAASSAPAATSPAATTPSVKPPKTTPKASKSAKSTPTQAPTTVAPATMAPTTAPATKPATTPTTSKPTTTKASAPATTPAPVKTTTSAAPSGTFTGATENTQYGPMEVQITVAAGKITGATELQQPDDSIASNAVNQLNSEAVAAQSASIQAVSGATYTSGGYIQSLQSAIDQAKL